VSYLVRHPLLEVVGLQLPTVVQLERGSPAEIPRALALEPVMLAPP
jgi:hypothetical protein